MILYNSPVLQKITFASKYSVGSAIFDNSFRFTRPSQFSGLVELIFLNIHCSISPKNERQNQDLENMEEPSSITSWKSMSTLFGVVVNDSNLKVS